MMQLAAWVLMLLCAGTVEGAPLVISKELKYDRRCTFEQRSFTGIRVFRERTIDLPSSATLDSRLVIVECRLGEPLYNLTLPINASLFGQAFTVPDRSKQIKFVRRPQYAGKSQLKYMPGTIVGAVYETGELSADGSDPSRWDPVTPLVADSWSAIDHVTYLYKSSVRTNIATSVLRSPDVLEKSFARNDDWVNAIPAVESSPASEGAQEATKAKAGAEKTSAARARAKKIQAQEELAALGASAPTSTAKSTVAEVHTSSAEPSSTAAPRTTLSDKSKPYIGASN